MNRPILMLRLLVLTLAALLCLCGCGGTGAAQPVNDERAAALAKELKANPSPFFPRIEGVDTLPSALCVMVTVDKVAYFLQDDALPTCAPEAAEAVLLLANDGYTNAQACLGANSPLFASGAVR